MTAHSTDNADPEAALPRLLGIPGYIWFPSGLLFSGLADRFLGDRAQRAVLVIWILITVVVVLKEMVSEFIAAWPKMWSLPPTLLDEPAPTDHQDVAKL